MSETLLTSSTELERVVEIPDQEAMTNLAKQLARAEFFGNRDVYEAASDELIERMAKAQEALPDPIGTYHLDTQEYSASDYIFNSIMATNTQELQSLNDWLFAGARPTQYDIDGPRSLGVLYDTPGAVIDWSVSDYMQQKHSSAIIRGTKDGQKVEWFLQPNAINPAVYDMGAYKVLRPRRIDFDKDDEAPYVIVGEPYRISADNGYMEMDQVDEVEMRAGTPEELGVPEEQLTQYADRGVDPFMVAYSLIRTVEESTKPVPAKEEIAKPPTVEAEQPSQPINGKETSVLDRYPRTVSVQELTRHYVPKGKDSSGQFKPAQNEATKYIARRNAVRKASKTPKNWGERAKEALKAARHPKALLMVGAGKAYVNTVEFIGNAMQKAKTEADELKQNPKNIRQLGKAALIGMGVTAGLFALASIHRKGGHGGLESLPLVPKPKNTGLASHHANSLLGHGGGKHVMAQAGNHTGETLKHGSRHLQHAHQAVSHTRGVKEVVVRSGNVNWQNPWTISEWRLHQKGIAHPTAAQIMAYDQHMARLNANVYNYYGNSSEYIPDGTKLKLPS